MSDHRVAVVGGGLAGLNAARVLAASGIDVALFEAESTVGGRVRSEHEDGFTFDRGFQVLFTAYPESRRALDMQALDLKRFPPGAVICRRNHRNIIADPLRDPLHAVETAFARDLTLGDKIRTLRLTRRLRSRTRAEIFAEPDASIDSYLREKGFSRRFLDAFAGPFYGGITLDRSLGTSKRVFEFTFKMLSEGYAAVPAAGMGAITSQLASHTTTSGATINTDTPVEGLDGTGPVELDLGSETVSADHVIVAAGPEATYELLATTDTSTETLGAIPRGGRGTVTQYFSLPAGNPVGKQSRILLNAGSSVPNQIATLSAVAPSYSPPDTILLSASTPGHVDEDEEELARQTRVALQSWYPEASFEALELLRTARIPFAQYAQPPGTHDDLPAVTAPEGEVYLAGDITEDSSINGALMSGRRAAEAVEHSI